jgi:hypothetical protein
LTEENYAKSVSPELDLNQVPSAYTEGVLAVFTLSRMYAALPQSVTYSQLYVHTIIALATISGQWTLSSKC